MVAPTSSTRTRLARADREQQVITAARSLFAERGYGAVTMEDVASAVGVTKPLLYTYFGNKERLYLACMEPAGDALIATVVDAVAQAPTAADALADGTRAFFAFVAADREAWRVLFDETLPASGDVARRVGEYRDRLTELVSDLLVLQLPPTLQGRRQVHVEALSAALMGASEALARWWLRTGGLPAAEAADLLIATVEPGLRARTRRPE